MSFRLNRFSPLALAPALLLSVSLSACDAELQDTPESMSLTARGATEVMPGDVLAIGMVDLQSIADNPLTTPFGEAGVFTRHLEGEARARFDDFVSVTGLDPQEDLSEVYAAIEAEGSSERVSLAIYGSFDREATEAYINSRLGDALSRSDYAGVPVYSSTNDRGGIAFALASDEMVVASSNVEGVSAMIDRLQGNGESVADNEALMRRIARASSAGDVWGVALKPASVDAPDGSSEVENQLAQLWLAIDAAGGGVDVRSDAMDTRLQFYPAEGVSTADLASLLRGALALARAQEGMNDEQRALLDDAEINAEGDFVSFQVTAPNAVFEGIAKH